MKTLAKIALLAIAFVGVAGVVLHLPPTFKLAWPTFTAPAPQKRDFPVPVAVAEAKIADVPVFQDGVGTVKALNTVTVKPQIDGKIIEITFTEGAEVKKGDVLARLDPVTVKAQLDQAAAKKALDEALLANSLRDLDRDVKVGTLGVTQQVIDTQKALVAQQQAQIQADKAAVDSAQAQLTYADILSPIDGVTGIRQVDVGNIVRNQTDPIVVITQIQPISVLFTLPQQDLGDVARGMAAGSLTADALTTDGGQVLDSGTLKVIDNQVDPTTGTIKLKADYPNPKRQLWPGQFVSVRLKVDTLKNVVVAPLAAVQQGPSGPFVYLVGENDDGDLTASVRPVTTGQTDGDLTVIASGLKAGDKIVSNGFSRLKDGAKISVGPPRNGGKPTTPPEAGATATPSADASGSVIATPAAAAETTPTSATSGDPTKQKHHRAKNGDGGGAGGTPPAANP